MTSSGKSPASGDVCTGTSRVQSLYVGALLLDASPVLCVVDGPGCCPGSAGAGNVLADVVCVVDGPSCCPGSAGAGNVPADVFAGDGNVPADVTDSSLSE